MGEKALPAKGAIPPQSIASGENDAISGFSESNGSPLFLSLAAVARGTSNSGGEYFLQNRYSSVPCLQRMGAFIRQEGKIAVVEGCGLLHGADV